jgi:putative acetyltransferase
MDIVIDDIRGPEIQALLQEHLDQMRATTPPGSIHALDVEALRKPDVTFWSAWEDGELLGCGALKQLDARQGEIKSMRTPALHRRKGVARAILETIISEAIRRGYRRLSLETGSNETFAPARNLYASLGFEYCEPFNGYHPDPNSVYMDVEL